MRFTSQVAHITGDTRGLLNPSCFKEFAMEAIYPIAGTIIGVTLIVGIILGIINGR